MNNMDNRRDEFLLRMYDQMFNNIDRHILVVWQSVSVLIGAFALFALSEKNIIPIDIACTLIVMIATWLIAHVFDASHWYNRNLNIIANIEREFLNKEDSKLIHFYFARHIKPNDIITQLKIQRMLGIYVIILVFLYHLLTRIIPKLGKVIDLFNDISAKGINGLKGYSFSIVIPYIFIIICLFYLNRIKNDRLKSLEDFEKKSPGKKL